MPEDIMVMDQAVSEAPRVLPQPHARSTYQIVSMVAYLLGVPKKIFEHDYEPPKLDIYERLEKNRHARIIRHLCILRTAIESKFKVINERMVHEYRSLMTIPEVPKDSIEQLAADGIQIIRAKYELVDYIMFINRLISDRINNCREVFPIWLSWQYVRNIFLMPNGLTEKGTKEAAQLYYANKLYYPYQMYMNWKPSDQGNILYNDRKFVTLLYEWNQDEFTDFSKVSDVSGFTKGSIYEFLDDSIRTVMVVDCENSDPYNLCATLNNLSHETMEKIVKIILYNDVNAASAWSILENYTKIPVENILIERVKENKSLVDIRLSVGACREFYENKADSFIIVSSDSDYWGLISSLPEARFLVMVEHDKCGPDLKAAMINSGITFCYIDDFYSGNSNDIKLNALIREVYRYMEQAVQLNVHEMMNAAFQSTRVVMSDSEKKQFYNRYIKPMHLVIDNAGNVSIQLQSK